MLLLRWDDPDDLLSEYYATSVRPFAQTTQVDKAQRQHARTIR